MLQVHSHYVSKKKKKNASLKSAHHNVSRNKAVYLVDDERWPHIFLLVVGASARGMGRWTSPDCTIVGEGSCLFGTPNNQSAMLLLDHTKNKHHFWRSINQSIQQQQQQKLAATKQGSTRKEAHARKQAHKEAHKEAHRQGGFLNLHTQQTDHNSRGPLK
jgi:hypothetical protein